MPENISLYWLAAGLVLIALELVVPAFFLVWFGLSAIVLAGFVFLVPLSLTAQVLVWSLFSIAMVALWIFIWKPSRKKVVDLTADNQVGMLIKKASHGRLGQIRFQEPVQGSDEWPCRYQAENQDQVESQGEINEGDRVRVIAVEAGVFTVVKA